MASTALNNRLIDAVKTDNDVDAARRTLKKGADVDAKTGMDRTMLYYAAEHGNKDMVVLLLAHHANPNHLDEEGFGPLHQAIAGGHLEIASLLLAAGADINIQDPHAMLGLTPLHTAFNADMRDEKFDRVQFVLEHGGDEKKRDTSQRSPMDAARERQNQFPFAGELLTYMKEWIQNRDDAARIAAGAVQAAADAALRQPAQGGIETDITVRRLRLKPAPRL